MGSSLFRTGILELKVASTLSPFLKFAQGAKKQLFYVKMAIFSSDQLDQLFRENDQLKLQRTLKEGSLAREGSFFSSGQIRSPSLSKILLRPLEKWSSSMWIQRPSLSAFPVEEDCPVVAGEQLLGLVEKVEGNACYVRLLGDPLMKVAVELADGETVPFSTWKLKTLRGDVEGIQPPYWGENGNLMKGQLFLHPQDRLHLPHPLPLEKLSNDLMNCRLVTSGLDGAFPKGLIVGKITKVITPLEGDCVFRFEAMPLPIWDDPFEVTLLQRRLQSDL